MHWTNDPCQLAASDAAIIEHPETQLHEGNNVREIWWTCGRYRVLLWAFDQKVMTQFLCVSDFNFTPRPRKSSANHHRPHIPPLSCGHYPKCFTHTVFVLLAQECSSSPYLRANTSLTTNTPFACKPWSPKENEKQQLSQLDEMSCRCKWVGHSTYSVADYICPWGGAPQEGQFFPPPQWWLSWPSAEGQPQLWAVASTLSYWKTLSARWKSHV